MAGIFEANRKDAMTPVERTFVLGAVTLLFALVFPTQEGEPTHWYEYALSFIASVGVGLISNKPTRFRVPVGAALLLANSFLFDFLFQRPDAFQSEYVIAGLLIAIIEPWLLPWIDPPGSFRRWCRERSWAWPLYYSVNAILLVNIILTMTLVAAVLSWAVPLGGPKGKLYALLGSALAALIGLPFLITAFANAKADGRARGIKNKVLLLSSNNLARFSRQTGLSDSFLLFALEPKTDRRKKNVQAALLISSMVAFPFATLALSLAVFYALNIEKPSYIAALSLLLVSSIVFMFFANKLIKLNHIKKTLISTPADLWLAIATISKFDSTPKGILFGENLPFEASDAMWQEAVARMGEKCDIILLDLAASAHDVTWEATHLNDAKPGRLILLSDAKTAVPTALQFLNIPAFQYTSAAGRKLLRDKLLEMSAGTPVTIS